MMMMMMNGIYAQSLVKFPGIEFHGNPFTAVFTSSEIPSVLIG
jgi:hypothetical protein